MAQERNPIPFELPAELVVVSVDDREEHILDTSPLPQIVTRLPTADYGLHSAPHEAAVERKSLPDWLGSLTQGRPRLDAEAVRMLGYPCRAIVIEASWDDLERGGWRNDVTPAAVIGTTLGYIEMGIPVILAGDHERAGRIVAKLLYTAARRLWRNSRGLLGDFAASQKKAAKPKAGGAQ